MIPSSSGQVLIGTSGVFMGMVFLNYIPKLKTFLPLRLQEGLQVSVGTLEPKDLSSACIKEFEIFPLNSQVAFAL